MFCTRCFLPLTVLLLFMALPCSVYADDASFPCKSARTAVELRVCNSQYASLKQLDRELAKWYRRAVRGVSDAEPLRANQREWIKSLDACLTSETVEAKKYVCDSVPEASKKSLCFRDFCLVEKYVARSQYLYALPTEGMPGRYVLADRWPSGIREAFDYLAPENLALCKSVEAALSAQGPLSSALNGKMPFSEISAHNRVSWASVEKSQQLPLAKLLEKLLRNKWRHDSDVVETERFTKHLVSRIATGEIAMAVAADPAVATGFASIEDQEVSILRYQRWGNSTDTTEFDVYGQFEFFRVDKHDLSSARPIGSADDAFLLNGKLYLDSISERSYDDRWQYLPIPQPELIVYTVQRFDSDNTGLRTACHLRYVQRYQK